jgi:hypothetical protein
MPGECNARHILWSDGGEQRHLLPVFGRNEVRRDAMPAQIVLNIKDERNIGFVARRIEADEAFENISHGGAGALHINSRF